MLSRPLLPGTSLPECTEGKLFTRQKSIVQFEESFWSWWLLAVLGGLMTVWWTHKWKKQDVPCISLASPYNYIPLQSAAGRSIWTTLMHCNSHLREHSVVLGQYSVLLWLGYVNSYCSFSEPYQHHISTIKRSVHSPLNIWHASKFSIYDGNRDLGMI